MESWKAAVFKDITYWVLKRKPEANFTGVTLIQYLESFPYILAVKENVQYRTTTSKNPDVDRQLEIDILYLFRTGSGKYWGGRWS